MSNDRSNAHAKLVVNGGQPVPRRASPETTVASFEVRYRQFLDPDGRLVAAAPPVADDRATLTALYRAMVLTRIFDAKAIALQRTGQLGTYPSCQGQEAVAVGVASAMADDDVMLPTYREQGGQLWRGVTMTEIFQFWSGDERGSDYAVPRQDFPVAVPIASQALHAAGVATAMKLRNEARAAVCFLGDGATSQGDFYEAINVAGAWRLPVLFVVVNNQWAISVPRTAQTAAETLAQKAIAAGIIGEQVDGNDIVAVRTAAEEALGRARGGGGPALIEMLTYRLGDHTTADDAGRYRSEQEVSAQWRNDPVARLRTYLGQCGWWSKADEESLLADAKARVEAAKDEFLALPPEAPTAMFDYLHETLPAPFAGQRKALPGGDNG